MTTPCTTTISILHSLGWGLVGFAAVGLFMLSLSASWTARLYQWHNEGAISKKARENGIKAIERGGWIVSIGAGIVFFLLTL